MTLVFVIILILQ